MKVLQYYECKGILIKNYLHFILFNRWHFQFHYRNDFISSQDITENVSKKFLDKMRESTLALE